MNQNIMRHTYRQLTADDKARVDAIKQKAQELWNVLDQLPPGREVALAKTRVEESAMWGVKAVTG